MRTSPIMQIHITVSEILWKIAYLYAFLVSCMALLEYLLITMEFCTFDLNSFDCMALLLLIVSIHLPCFVLFFNFEKVGTSLNFSWNVF